ncbi:unnamed protein product [Oikopleura dioica]|uniref:Neurotransmitter-gated ion-channel ligand-binding domain-containing protein n=1 Tax=Oikopleura dioica TaxID=34765 RepID=E4XMR4_OIKDI|nr:unnamed protein product [Oikopleura dioica]
MRTLLLTYVVYTFLVAVESESAEKARIRRMLEDKLTPFGDESAYRKSSETLQRSPRKMDKRIRPFEDIAPLNVSINLFISSFDSIAETTMDFGLTFIMRLRWQDPRMMFPDITNEKTYNNRTILTMDLKFLDELWVPDVFFANEKSANVHQITSDNKRLRIDSAGYIYLEMRLSATLSCHMRFEHFPMDVQVCAIEIESFAYDTADVNFDWDSTPGGVELARSIELPQFKLQGHVLGKCESPRGNFTCIEGKFILSRQMGYYLIQFPPTLLFLAYVPTTLIVMLSWISFWISINATPARVSLGITTVLTITSQRSALTARMLRNREFFLQRFILSNKHLISLKKAALPMVSYVMAIDIWMSLCMAYVFAAVVEYAIANFIDKPDIDRLARRAFPSTFAVVCCFYYAYYAVCVNELPGLSEKMTRWVGDEGVRKLKP